LCDTEALKGYNMKIMAEYVIKEIDFEDLENILWDGTSPRTTTWISCSLEFHIE